MRDTLRERDYIVVLRTEFLTRHQLFPRISAHRGQIVVLQAPSDPSVVLVKRVIALGGDRIRIFNGKVIPNGVVQNENYVVGTHGNIADSSWPSDWGLEGQRDIIVPADHYFVLGDNRDSSMDSRHWGSVPVENVIGKTVLASGIDLRLRQSTLGADNLSITSSNHCLKICYIAHVEYRNLSHRQL